MDVVLLITTLNQNAVESWDSACIYLLPSVYEGRLGAGVI